MHERPDAECAHGQAVGERAEHEREAAVHRDQQEAVARVERRVLLDDRGEAEDAEDQAADADRDDEHTEEAIESALDDHCAPSLTTPQGSHNWLHKVCETLG